MRLEEIEQYLPTYLSESANKSLFENLKQFPYNIDKRFYSSSHLEDHIVFQGDGFQDILVVDLPEEKIRKAPCMVLSNTCDIDQANQRLFSPRICYAPILRLERYHELLLNRKPQNEHRVNDHLSAIKRQEVSQIFYLPVGRSLEYDGIVFFDRLNNCDNKALPRTDLSTRRLFSLSNYGLYVFLFKLSVHFTRIREGIDRS